MKELIKQLKETGKHNTIVVNIPINHSEDISEYTIYYFVNGICQSNKFTSLETLKSFAESLINPKIDTIEETAEALDELAEFFKK